MAIFLLFSLSYFYIKDLNFFVSDIGLRYLQITQLIEHQWQTFAIDYPLRFVDPTFEHVSYYRAYGILDDEIYFFISPFFPLLVSFLYLCLGSAGLPIIPVIGGVTTAWGTYKLAEVSKLRYPLLAFWGTILATPVLFYSLVLWDHTLTTALTTLAVYGVVKGIEQQRQSTIFWGGIALGLAVNQRPEAYIFTIALGITLLILSWPKWQPPLTLAIGGVVGALPLWIWQYFWVGHPLGMATAPNLFGYSVPEKYPFPDPLVGFTPLQQRLWFLVHLQQNSVLSLIIAISLLVGTVTIILALRSVVRSGFFFYL